MAREKKPSIYVDRGTIGSHDELDEYGVWVKSEPQDLSFTGTDSRETLEDFEEFSEDVFEEASSADDLDLAISDVDDLPDFGGSQESDSLDFPVEDSSDDLVMEDDFDLPQLGETYEENLPADETADFDEIVGFDESVGFDEAVGLDESTGLEETIEFDEAIGFDESTGLDETVGFDEAVGLDESAGLEETVEFDEVIGFDESVGLDETVEFDEAIELDESAGLEESVVFDETIELDESADSLALPEELPLEDLDAITLGSGADEEFTEIVLEDIEEHQDTEAVSELPSQQDLAGEELTDSEYPVVQTSDAQETEEAPIVSPVEQKTTNDASSLTLSTQLLMKIAEELSSIRSELSTLKRDFSSVSAAPLSPAPPAGEDEDEKIALTGDELSTILSTETEAETEIEAPAEETTEAKFFDEEEDEKIALTGDELSTILSTETETEVEIEVPTEEPTEAKFFDEEEDEKIALTGDELSNILNTADFTEEAGSDAAMEELAEDSTIDSTIQEEEDIPADFPESEADTVLLEEQESSLELIDLETEFTPIGMDSSLEEADLEELELEYPRGELPLEDTAAAELETAAPGEETEEHLVEFDPPSDSFEFTESIESIESIETSSYLESTDFELPLEEETLEEAEAVPETTSEEEVLPDFATEEIEELNEIQESGVEPITFAPDVDDANYLTEDPLSEDPLSFDEIIDLSEAVIDEPDLSSEIQDNPVEEPSLEDISIDLDLEEDISIPEDIFDEGSADLESEIEVLDKDFDKDIELSDIEFSMDISESISDSVLIDEEISAFETEDADEDQIDVLSSTHVSSSEDGGDLSLIPEGFVVDAAESDSVELDSMESVSAELISTEFPDFPEDSAAEEEVEEIEMEIEVGSPELDVQELDSAAELDSDTELDPGVELHVELDSDDDIISMDDIDDFMTETEETVEEIVEIQDEPPLPEKVLEAVSTAVKVPAGKTEEIPSHLKKELKTVLSYMDQLLESLPDEKIEEFAKSEYYDTYKKLFKELGLV